MIFDNAVKTLGHAKTLADAEAFIEKSEVPFTAMEVLATVIINLADAGDHEAQLIRSACAEYEERLDKETLVVLNDLQRRGLTDLSESGL